MQAETLTPTQLTLLARGAIRFDGAIPPLATAQPDAIGTLDAAADQLVQSSFAQWIAVVDGSLAWKQKHAAPVGLVITDLGRAALDLLEIEIAETAPAPSKIGHVLAMLRSSNGISLAEITVATGWQPHSARAALTTLRKKGFAIVRDKEPDRASPRYRIAAEVIR